MKFKELAEKYGGVTALAKKIKKSRNAVKAWCNYNSFPRTEQALALLDLSGGKLDLAGELKKCSTNQVKKSLKKSSKR